MCPAALVVVFGLPLNKALSKSLRWWEAGCLIEGASFGVRRGRLGHCRAIMSALVELVDIRDECSEGSGSDILNEANVECLWV